MSEAPAGGAATPDLARERHRRAAMTGLASLLARGSGLLVTLVAIRVALPALGTARFGVWMTIASLTTVLMVFDLGIGNGLVSRVAMLAARGDQAALRRQVALALSVLGLIGALVAAALGYAAAHAPIDWLYPGSPPALVSEARQSFVWFAVLLGASMPLQAVHRVRAGLQEGHVAQAVAGCMNLASLALLPLLPAMHAGIPQYLLATYGLQVASGALLLPSLVRRYGLALPRWRGLQRGDVAALAGSGGLFLLLQVAGVIAWDMDVVLASSLLGATAVASYTIVQQLFLLVSGPLALANAPLWAGYADAHARGEAQYLRETLRRSLLATLGLAAAGAALVALLHPLLAKLLTRSTLAVDPVFAWLFAAWTVLGASGNAFAMYLNGVHVLRPQVVLAVALVCVSLALKLLLVGNWGLRGLVAATLVAYAVCVIIPYATAYRRVVLAPLRGHRPAA